MAALRSIDTISDNPLKNNSEYQDCLTENIMRFLYKDQMVRAVLEMVIERTVSYIVGRK
jgi:hypothetical protein